ncbi:MAG: hypothetical protein C0173_00795, partial [Desulfurella sp.]|uniref:replication initiator protein A n=1 Tax=Desulfurella sp. TaxID=1962857 RepID=UPI000CAF4C45
MKNKENKEVIRNEVNILKYPLFSLNERKRKTEEIKFSSRTSRNGEIIEIHWNVYPHSKYGTPTVFDKKIFMFIIEKIENLPKPISNPIALGSTYSILKNLNLNLNVRNYQRFANSIKRMISTKIESVESFYSKSEKTWINDFFGLFDRAIFKGEQMPDGTVADQTYIYLGSRLIDNINANYIKPLDMNYYNMLKKPMATRLYEILGVKFFALFQNEKSSRSIKFSYELLCDLMPVTKQKQISLIKQQFLPSLEKLKSTGFLSNFKIENENEKVYIYFYPGP